MLIVAYGIMMVVCDILVQNKNFHYHLFFFLKGHGIHTAVQ